MPTESQLRDTALRLRIRELLEKGLLPAMVPKEIHGGYGAGNACVACDQPITSTQVEYEVLEPQTGSCLHFHLGCHVVWQISALKHVCAVAINRGPDSRPCAGAAASVKSDRLTSARPMFGRSASYLTSILSVVIEDGPSASCQDDRHDALN
jgi:hypothetical protein